MAHEGQVSSTVVLLADIPPLDRNADPATTHRELCEAGYASELPAIVAASLVEDSSGNQPPAAVYELHGNQSQNLPPFATLMYHVSPATIHLTISPHLRQLFTQLKQKYRTKHLAFNETADGVFISGPIGSVSLFIQQFQQKSPQVLLSIPNPELPAARPLQNEQVYDNLNPDALALLSKLPSGQIDGIRYDCPAGKIFVDSVSSELENQRTTKFQTAFHNIIGKIKADMVRLQASANPAAVNEIVAKFDSDYDQCVFLRQDGGIRVVSCSSRQFDQVKVLLAQELRQFLTADSVEIEFGQGRTLTLKQADLTKEVVDVIVNPANNSLQHSGGVAAALNQASNGSLQTNSDAYLQKHHFVHTGKVCPVKAGGDLHCRSVINAVGPTNSLGPSECERLMQSVVNETLKCAERAKAKSISFPAISTGIFGVDKDLVARVMVDTILDFLFKKPDLTDIRIVIIDTPTFEPFARYFNRKKVSLEAAAGGGGHGGRPKLGVSSSPSGADGGSHGEVRDKAPEGAGATPGSADKPLSKSDLDKLFEILKPLGEHWRKIGGKLLGLTAKELSDKFPFSKGSRLRKVLNEWHSQAKSPTISVLVNMLLDMDTKQAEPCIAALYGFGDGAQAKVDEVSPSNNSDKDVSEIDYPKINDSGNQDPHFSAEAKSDSASDPPAAAPPTTTPTGPAHVAGDTTVTSTATLSPLSTPPPGLTVNAGPTGYNGGQMWGYPTNSGQGPQFLFTGDNLEQVAQVTASTTSASIHGGNGQQPVLQSQGPLPHMGEHQQLLFSGVTNILYRWQPYGNTWVPVDAPTRQEHQPLFDNVTNTLYVWNGSGWMPAGIPSHQPSAQGRGRGIAAKFPAKSQAGTDHVIRATASPMNYSQAAGGGVTQLGDSSVVTTQPQPHTGQQDSAPTQPSSSGNIASGPAPGESKVKDQEKESCPICKSDDLVDPVETKCHHKFCRGCLTQALKYSPFCAICKAPLKHVVGNQPEGGKMSTTIMHNSLPGYRCATIRIEYLIPNGVQSQHHPNPGRRYHGTNRTAYLPNNREGKEVLELLRRAFEARLVFTVGNSITSGQSDVVTWNDIHHKTSTHGGPQNYGYPDPTYLGRVKEDLAAKGIVPDTVV